MKIYRVSDPEMLKQFVPLMKDPADAAKVQTRAIAWSTFARKGNPDAMVIHLELSRSARLYVMKKGEKTVLGAVKLNAARDLAKGLEEIHEST